MSFIVFTTLVVAAGALLDRWTQRDAARPVAGPPEGAAAPNRPFAAPMQGVTASDRKEAR